MPERNSLFSPPVDQEMHGDAHNTFIQSSRLGITVSREGMAGLIKVKNGGRVEFVGKSNVAEALDAESSYNIKGFVGWASIHGAVGDIEGNIGVGHTSGNGILFIRKSKEAGQEDTGNVDAMYAKDSRVIIEGKATHVTSEKGGVVVVKGDIEEGIADGGRILVGGKVKNKVVINGGYIREGVFTPRNPQDQTPPQK